MNAFNRVVTVLAVIILWIAVVLVAAVPEQVLSWTALVLDGAGQLLALLSQISPSWLFPALRAALLGLVTIVALVLLWAELRRMPTPTVRVQLASGGDVVVTADSVARRLAWHIDQLADVITVHPTVQRRGGGVDVRLELETAPDIEVPMKTEEVMALTREVIEDHMGLQLRRLKVEISHAPFPEPLEVG